MAATVTQWGEARDHTKHPPRQGRTPHNRSEMSVSCPRGYALSNLVLHFVLISHSPGSAFSNKYLNAPSLFCNSPVDISIRPCRAWHGNHFLISTSAC